MELALHNPRQSGSAHVPCDGRAAAPIDPLTSRAAHACRRPPSPSTPTPRAPRRCLPPRRPPRPAHAAGNLHRTRHSRVTVTCGRWHGSSPITVPIDKLIDDCNYSRRPFMLPHTSSHEVLYVIIGLELASINKYCRI